MHRPPLAWHKLAVVLLATLCEQACGPPPEVAAAYVINGLIDNSNPANQNSSSSGSGGSGGSGGAGQQNLDDRVYCDQAMYQILGGTLNYSGNATGNTATISATIGVEARGPGFYWIAGKHSIDCTLTVSYGFDAVAFKLTKRGTITDCSSFNCTVNTKPIDCATMKTALAQNGCKQ